jgi:hypothetical protein
MFGRQELLLLPVIIVLLMQWFLLAIAAACYARRLHRSKAGWFLFALLLSHLNAFVFLFALGPQTRLSSDAVDEPDESEFLIERRARRL